MTTSPPALRFTGIDAARPGTLARLLTEAYGYLLRKDPTNWAPQQATWEDFDRAAYATAAIARCVFLSWQDRTLVGLGSIDPRGAPAVGLVGHHCILPPHQGSGLGRLQFAEIERRLTTLGCRKLRVTTLDLAFFAPARRLYHSAGFRLVAQTPWAAQPKIAQLHFEKDGTTAPVPSVLPPREAMP